jgi:hypothetical protein
MYIFQNHRKREAEEAELEKFFSRKTVFDALFAWIEEEKRTKSTIKVPLPEEEDSGNFNKQRNSKLGGKFGLIANACGVSFNVLKRMEKYGTTPQPEQYGLICRALIRNGRLGEQDADPPPVVPVPTSAHSNLMDRLEELSIETAQWRVPQNRLLIVSAGQLAEDAKYDALRDAALDQAEFDIADAAIILKGCIRIKASLLASYISSWDLVRDLGIIHHKSRNPALVNAAALTQARLIRELTLLIHDAAERIKWFAQAAIIMGSVRGGDKLPCLMPLPGLASEMASDDLIWRHGHDPMTDTVPNPLRYKSSLYIGAFFQAYLANPQGIQTYKSFLNKAEKCANEGIVKFPDLNQARWNSEGTKVEVAAVRHIIETGDNGQSPGTSENSGEAGRNARWIDKLTASLSKIPSLTPGKRASFESTITCWKALFAYKGDKRLCVLADQVLPMVERAYVDLPVIKSMMPQECSFQFLFMRNHKMAEELLRACGYSPRERLAHLPRIMPSSFKLTAGSRTP